MTGLAEGTGALEARIGTSPVWPPPPMPLGVFHPDLWWGIDHRFRKDGNGWQPNVIRRRTLMNRYEDLKLVLELETSQ